MYQVQCDISWKKSHWPSRATLCRGETLALLLCSRVSPWHAEKRKEEEVEEDDQDKEVDDEEEGEEDKEGGGGQEEEKKKKKMMMMKKKITNAEMVV